MSDQLGRVQALADERRRDEGLYEFQRETDATFRDLLCYLLGLGAISDEHLEIAIQLERSSDERIRKHRAATA